MWVRSAGARIGAGGARWARSELRCTIADSSSGASSMRLPTLLVSSALVLGGCASVNVQKTCYGDGVCRGLDYAHTKRDSEGRWPLETQYPGKMPVEMDAGEGRPSRWNTLRALRVLRWYAAGA